MSQAAKDTVEELLRHPYTHLVLSWLAGVYIAVLINMLLPRKFLLVCGFGAEAVFLFAALDHYGIYHVDQVLNMPPVQFWFTPEPLNFLHAVLFAAGLMFSALGSALVQEDRLVSKDNVPRLRVTEVNVALVNMRGDGRAPDHGIAITLRGTRVEKKQKQKQKVGHGEEKQEEAGEEGEVDVGVVSQLKLEIGDEEFWRVVAGTAVPSWVVQAVKWTALPMSLVPKYVPNADLDSLRNALAGGQKPFELRMELATKARNTMGVSHVTIRRRIDELEAAGDVVLYLRLRDQHDRLLAEAPMHISKIADTIRAGTYKENILHQQQGALEEKKVVSTD